MQIRKCKTLPEGVEESKTTPLRGLNKARKHNESSGVPGIHRICRLMNPSFTFRPSCPRAHEAFVINFDREPGMIRQMMARELNKFEVN